MSIAIPPALFSPTRLPLPPASDPLAFARDAILAPAALDENRVAGRAR
jgi:hypothetical protein